MHEPISSCQGAPISATARRRSRPRARCAPTISVCLAPVRPHQVAGDRREHHHHQPGGCHPQTGREDRLPEPVAGGRRQLQQLGYDDRLRHHPEADRHRRDVREQDLGPGGRPQVDQRVAAGAARARPKQQHDEPADDRAPGATGAPAPVVALGDADQEGDQADRQAEPADHVEPTRLGVVDVGHQEDRREQDHQASPAETQNIRCQSWPSAIHAAKGRPIAPPTPSVALIAAIAVPVMCGGVNSRISEMPTGMNPIANPCRARPASTGTQGAGHRHDAEPATRRAALTTSTRCLP